MYAEDLYPVTVSGGGGLPKATDPGIPEAYRLHANHPNPFNPTTVIPYDLAEQSEITLTIYDILGREVRRWQRREAAGYKSVMWNGKDKNNRPVPTGIYVYQFEAVSRESGQRFISSSKMLLLK